jgi:hypothetical protein
MTAQTDTIRSGYADMIDNSTPQTLASTLAEAADAARLDAETCQGKAEDLRAEAAGLEDKPGMREAAESFLREAVQWEETAENRRGMAAAYDTKAAEALAAASA